MSHLPLGIMIETPAAALMADKFAPMVDFFSIGTNDLVQYTMAIDRGNERVAYLYRPSHPAILGLIRNCVEAANRHNIWVSVCGQAAAPTPIWFRCWPGSACMSSAWRRRRSRWCAG